jgi:hypothetical protein
MIINIDKFSDQETVSTCEENDIVLSKDSQSMFFSLFTKNIYSNPIGSIVREITSNCFDSHIEAGCNMPVLIKKSIEKDTNTNYISFIDYGVGMSPERIDKVFRVMFSSTKRSDNAQIGGFGLGSKSCLAYKRSTGFGEGEYDNSYYIITVYDKIKYIYNIYEGQKCPKISLLHSEPTEDGNGTEVKIPVLEKDLRTFEYEMIRQLYYFENIIFEGFDSTKLTNDYQIIRGKSFLFRGNEYKDSIHVCLGRVAYPLDYNTLGLNESDYRLPVAIKLNVGDINVVASREGLDYSEKTIKVVKAKLEEVKSEIIGLISKQYENIVTLEDYFKVKSKFGFLYFSNGLSINVGNVISVKDINYKNFRYNSLKSIPKDTELFKLFFNVEAYGKKLNKNVHRRTIFFDGSFDEILRKNFVYYIDTPMERKRIKRAYMKSLHETYFVIRKNNFIHSTNRETICDLFNVNFNSFYNKSTDGQCTELTDFSKTLLMLRDELFEIVTKYRQDYNEVNVPENFILEKKRNIIDTKILRETKIQVKFFGVSGKDKVKLSALFDLNIPIFYGSQDDENKLNNARYIHTTLFGGGSMISYYEEYGNKINFNSDKKGILFIMLSKGNLKYMQYCKKAYHIDNYYWKMLHRKADMVYDYFNSFEFIQSYQNLSSMYKSNKFDIINKDWGRKIKKVNEYYQKIISNKNKNIGDIRQYLTPYFNLSNLNQSTENKK